MNKITRFYLPSPEVSGAVDINVDPFIIQPSHYNKISKEKECLCHLKHIKWGFSL